MMETTDIQEKKHRRYVTYTVAGAAALFLVSVLTLRLSYVGTRAGLEQFSKGEQMARARLVTQVMESRFDTLKSQLGAMTGLAEVKAPEDAPAVARAALRRNLKSMEARGVTDLALTRKDGTVELTAAPATGAFFLPGTTLRTYEFAADESGEAAPGQGTDHTRRGRFSTLVVWLPVYRSATATQSFTGYLAAAVRLQAVSNQLRRMLPAEDLPFIVNSKGLILAHPTKEFLGMSLQEAIGGEDDARTKDLFNRIASAGSEGTGTYIAPTARAAGGNIRWEAVYTPVRVFWRDATLGYAWPAARLPLARRVLAQHLAAALAAALFLAAAVWFLLKMGQAHLTAQKEIRRLRDTSAINEILRNVNEQLTEAKRQLEEKHEEIGAHYEQYHAAMEELTRLQEKLFDTLKRPSKEQRDMMREARRRMADLTRRPGLRLVRPAPEE